MDVKDAALLVSTCITLNLPPALTLEQGLDKIKEAVNQLKSKPPSCSSGMYRIQVLEFYLGLLLYALSPYIYIYFFFFPNAEDILVIEYEGIIRVSFFLESAPSEIPNHVLLQLKSSS